MNIYDSLFEGLPAIDANIDYGDQAELLQICNVALLDEIKRIEDDNREAIFRLNFKQQDGYRSAKYETNPKEPFLMNAPHDANHKQFNMFEYENMQPTHPGVNNGMEVLLNQLEMAKE